MQAYLPEDKQHIASQVMPRNELTFIYGGEGLLSSASLPPSAKYIFPVSKNRLMNETISQEARDFARKHTNLVVANFNNYIPSEEFFKEFIEFVQAQNTYGFLISLNTDHLYKLLKNSDLPKNCILEKKASLEILLKELDVKLLITTSNYMHLIYSIQYKVPILAISLNLGEHGIGCEIAEEKGLGICSAKDISASSLSEDMSRLEQNDFCSRKLTNLNKALNIKAQEKRGLVYWIDYQMEIGDHLNPK